MTFQSTHPGWGATKFCYEISKITYISIHAPRVGCDYNIFFCLCQGIYISIHAPRVGCD